MPDATLEPEQLGGRGVGVAGPQAVTEHTHCLWPNEACCSPARVSTCPKSFILNLQAGVDAVISHNDCWVL